MSETRKPILDVLNGKKPERVPFWLMRQAGRYLPEYRELRAKAQGFLDLVYNPENAAEVTIQPLRRYGMDAAILFSDILVVPHALGQAVSFEAGEGPKLDPILSEKDFSRLNADLLAGKAAPVYETVTLVREKLASEKFDRTALIGFCGSPWTVICYMTEGGGSKDFHRAKNWAANDPASFRILVDLVTHASCEYLAGQIRAGAETVQLFDSWSGLLEGDQFKRWVIEPTQKIRQYLRDNFPQIRVIGFPRGAGLQSLAYARETGVDCLGLDQTIDRKWAADNLQTIMPVQGNLAPELLMAGGESLEESLQSVHDAFGGGPWIFNLGHGVVKETKPENVAHLRDTVRGWKI
jgi:uroporphyrinogen decarboxylase